MTNMQDLLGKIFEADVTPNGNDKLRNAVNSSGPQESNPLGGLFDAFKDSGAGNLLDSLSNVAKDMYSQTKAGVESGNPLAIGGLAALAGAILGGGRQAIGGAVGAGALAILAKFAYDAMQKQKNATADPSDLPLGLRQPANADEERQLESRAALILQAMVNAAKADGKIADDEMQRITSKLQEAGADQSALAFIKHQMAAPADMDALIRAVPDQATALQVYAASLLAITVDTPAEKAYLAKLAQGLGLSADEVSHLQAALGVTV